MRRAFLQLLAMVTALALAAPAGAADVSFDPVLTVSAERTDDVLASAGGAGLAGDQSDVALTLEARLALLRRTPRSEVSLIYHPFYEAYQDYGELDNTSHRLLLGWTAQLSRRSEWEASLSYSRVERQRVDFDNPAQDLVVLPRTTLDTFAATAQLRQAVSQRSRLLLYASLAGNRYDSGQTTGIALADVTTTSAQVGWEFDLSSLAVAGVSFYGSRLDEGFRGQRDVLRLLGVYRRATENSSLTLSAGVAKTTVNDPGEGIPADVQIEEPTDPVASLSLQRTFRRRGQVQIDLYRDVSSSSGTGGASLSTGGFVALRVPTGRWSSFALFSRYDRREPQQGQIVAFETRTVSYRTEWSVAFGPRWYLVTAGERFDQSSDEQLLDRNYTIWSLGLRYSPLARGR